MPVVVGVRFKDSGKIYHFDPRDVPLMVGDWAVVDTSRGPELGRVAAAAGDIAADDLVGEIKPVLRRASPTDLASLAHYEQYLEEALSICSEKARAQNLPMRMVKAEYSFDGSRLTFFFTADKRVDFRLLVRELARTFHTRIELRQIGPRDEAKLLGGIGPCGRALCCSTFLPDYAKVSIKMAKDQDLPLNPVKVSGVCGRLLCCLSYEEDQYLAIKAELPGMGAWVQTPEGPGEVVALNVVRETVSVQLGVGTTADFTAAQISTMTEQVAAEARSRNAAGITPANQLQAELAAGLDPDALAVLSRMEEAPRDGERPRPVPRALRPDATILPQGDRNRAPRPAGGDSAGPRAPVPGRERPLGPGRDTAETRATPLAKVNVPPRRTGDVQPSDRAAAGAPAPDRTRDHPRPGRPRLAPGQGGHSAPRPDGQPKGAAGPRPVQQAAPAPRPERRPGRTDAPAAPEGGETGEAVRRHRKRNRGDRTKE